MNQTKAVIYCRVSTEKDTQETSLIRQQEYTFSLSLPNSSIKAPIIHKTKAIIVIVETEPTNKVKKLNTNNIITKASIVTT